ncbi:death domain-associated protein 6 isoform X2 [Pristis pectinata]|uniref:death domain-associated protein 6 isoform X2 n=1 Tax=Pristis pectinata TaxID=685728 RepID=UPI00223E6427|nr:death domain-associated protein 6 isoform X2 [Pristis pectinata]
MALRWGGGERLQPGPASGDVVNLLSDEEEADGAAAEAQAQAAASSYRPRRVKLQPPALEAVLPGLGDVGPEEEQREHDRGLVRFENQKLFSEFVEFCGTLTEENPEVINFLQRKYSKAFPEYLASTEFRNVLGRCLTRVQGKKSKVFVYINELCTALKANSQKTKLTLASKENSRHQLTGFEGQSVTDTKEKEDCPERTSAPSEDASTSVPNPTAVEKKRTGTGSRRQIRYLENLLKVYSDEIKRLQERELDLKDLEDEDSSYVQEHRLKKKMVKIFEKLCELKNCSSLTGRVIEQRIPFTGTRYPEINRKVEKFINKPDHFPDYQDIRNIMHKVSTRHNLGLSQRQIQSMAQDVFREVGNRLQERRHLDLVYNFGSHLTDDYKPGKDPAMMDITLEKRLRQNRTVALGRLDEVVKKYAELQDVGEMQEEEKRKKKKLHQSAVTPTSKAESEDVKEEQEQVQKVEEAEGKGQKEEAVEDAASEEEEEEDDDEEEDEDLSSEPDIEEELSKIEEAVEAEEEPQEDEKAEGSEVDETEVQSEDSPQSSDESEEESESAEAQAGEVVGTVCPLEGDTASINESSPTCTSLQEPACSLESKSPTAETAGSDDVIGPVDAVEEGVGSSNEGTAVGSSGEEVVRSSSESMPANIMEQDVVLDNAKSPVIAAEGKDQLGAEVSTICTTREVIESAGSSPAPTDREELKGEQPTRQAKRKRADSSGQKLEMPILPSKAWEDISVNKQKVVNSLSARTCDIGTLACSEVQSLTVSDDANLDKKPVIDKENLLETDRRSPEICLTAVNGKERDSVLDGSPVAKRIKRGGDEEHCNVEVIELMESDEGTEELLTDCAPSLVGVKSPLPAVDSTQADSPLVSVVTSSQPSPVNVATQCDPEEIIVLSDSD